MVDSPRTKWKKYRLKMQKTSVWSSQSLPVPLSRLVGVVCCVQLCDPMDCSTPGLPVHHQLPAYSSSCPLSWWCHPTISSSVIPFSSHLQYFPASGSFPMSQFFGGQSIGVSASASALPMNIQDWFPLGWTGLISLQSKGLSRVFSKHQLFGTQPSS